MDNSERERIAEHRAKARRNRERDGPPALATRDVSPSPEGTIVALFEPATKRGAHILALKRDFVGVLR